MSTTWILLPVAAVLLALAIDFIVKAFVNTNFGWYMAGCLAGLISVLIFFFVGINLVTMHYDKANCHKYQYQTGRTTRWVRYNYWQADCLTPSNDGHWIPIDQLRSIK